MKPLHTRIITPFSFVKDTKKKISSVGYKAKIQGLIRFFIKSLFKLV